MSVLAFAFVSLALVSASASAATGRPLLSSIFTGGETRPRSLATDSSGNLYVLEYGVNGQAIEKFDSAGNPADFTASGSYISGNKLTGTPTERFQNDPGFTASLVIDHSGGPTEGYIYAVSNYAEGGGIHVFDPTGAYQGTIKGNSLYSCGLAERPSTGELYWNEIFTSTLVRLGPAGAGPTDRVVNGRLKEVPEKCAVAVDSTGAIYLSGYYYEGGSFSTGVRKYEPSQLDAEAPVSTEIEPNAASALAIDPADDDVFIDLGTRVVQRSAAGALVGEFGAGSLTESQGVAPDGDNVYVAEANGTISTFGPPAQLPLVKTEGVAALVQNSVTVEGEVDPDSAGDVSGCEFRYGRDAAYADGSIPCSPGASEASPITGPAHVSAGLSGLLPGTTYHYRLFAQNANGVQPGRDQTFTTPVAIEGVTTGEATAVTKDSAVLSGSYVGDGQDVHYYFEYGTGTGYGQSAPTPPGNDAGSASGEQGVAPVALSGLKGETTYHYRLVASNSFGKAYGQDMTFTTAPAVTGLTTDPPTAVTNEAADLHGSFDADGYDVHYYFEWGPTTAYGNVVPAPPGNDVGSGSGRESVPPLRISGLQEGATYHYRIVASSENGTTLGPDLAFKTAERPSIANLSTAEVTATGAELGAEINPNQGDTHYRFEWGQSTAYGNSVPVPDGDAGDGATPQRVHAQLEGLSSGVTYHFRVVATNPYGSVTSGDQTFSFYPPACPNAQLRQETGSNDLPDCRAYELTTPSNAQGAVIFPLNGPNTGLATNPARVSYGAAFGTLPDTGDPMNSVNDLYVSTRTDTGWYTKYIGRPANESLLMGGPPEGTTTDIFQGQSPSVSQFGAATDPSMSRFLNYDQGNPSGVYGQLGEPSNAPFVWNASTGALIERWPTNLGSVSGGKDFVGTPKVSPDFNHFVFSSNVAFAPGGEEFEAKIVMGGHSVFEGMCCSAPVYDNTISSGRVSLVSIKENGEPFKGAPVHLSDDGSRILMSETNDVATGANRPLFVRVDDSRTYDIAGGKPVHYAGSTADGKTVYVTSAEQLTADDHDSSTDLFVWRESEPHSLTRVSVGNGGAAGNSDSCGASWVGKCGVGLISLELYFGAPGGTAGQATGNGTSDGPIAKANGDIYFESPEQLVAGKGEPDQVNLYLYRDGSVRYVTTMTPTVTCDEENENVIACSQGPVARMQITPSGDHMAFITASRLTAYDTNGHSEMYAYSPATERIVCASCRPDGQPAKSSASGSQNGLFLTTDGRVFFSTRDPLMPRDTNGANDVYEYVEGKPQLISAGLGLPTEGFSGFYGSQTLPGLVSVSANGTDAYFATYDNLVTQDHNGQEIKIYDARTGGGFPAERPRPDCAAADECHGAGSARPGSPLDRTSAQLGKPSSAPKHRKHKHAKHKKHRKHKHAASKKKKGKGRAKPSHAKQGGHDRG